MLPIEPYHPIRVKDFIFTVQDKSTLIRIFNPNGREIDCNEDFDITVPDWYISNIGIGMEEDGTPCIMITAGRDLEFVVVVDPEQG